MTGLSETTASPLTAVALGFLGMLLYWILTSSSKRNAAATIPQAPPTASTRGAASSSTTTTASGATARPKTTVPSTWTRLPPHVHAASCQSVLEQHQQLQAMQHNHNNNRSNQSHHLLLHEGLVKFGHTKAAATPLTLSHPRKLRARILTRLVENANGSTGILQSPPSKGAKVVLTIRIQDLSCLQLRRVLMLLGTYYNLLVLLARDDHNDNDTLTEMTKADRQVALDSLRTDLPNQPDSAVSVQILPNHRITMASSWQGRVAFCRQVSPELILDFEPRVQQELQRFQHVVRLYSSASSEEEGVSGLGRELLGPAVIDLTADS